MTRMLSTLTALALVGLFAAFATRSPDSEDAAVRQAVQFYIDGQAAGDGAIVAKAFHPEAHLTHIRDGAIQTMPIEQYLGFFNGQPAPDEADRKRWIESVDVTGDAAVAKVVLDYPRVRYTDYMSLLKVGGEWKIIHKNYTMSRK